MMSFSVQCDFYCVYRWDLIFAHQYMKNLILSEHFDILNNTLKQFLPGGFCKSKFPTRRSRRDTDSGHVLLVSFDVILTINLSFGNLYWLD